jgi:hypothetical protein
LDNKNEEDWKKKEKNKRPTKIWNSSFLLNKPLNNMLTSTSTTQTTLSIVKEKFAKVITEETLFPTNKPSDWNVVITKKALLNAMRMPSSPLEEIWHGLATSYDTTFSTTEEYCDCYNFDTKRVSTVK